MASLPKAKFIWVYRAEHAQQCFQVLSSQLLALWWQRHAAAVLTYFEACGCFLFGVPDCRRRQHSHTAVQGLVQS